MGDIMEKEDEQIEERLAGRRHKEIKDLLGKLQPKEDTEMKQLIKSVHSALTNFKSNVSVESPKIDIPQSQVNVSVDNKEITGIIKDLVSRIETSNNSKIENNNKLIDKLDEWISESKRGKQFNINVKRNEMLPYRPIESINGEIK